MSTSVRSEEGPFVAVADYEFIARLWGFLSRVRGRLGEAPLEAECEHWLSKLEVMKSIMEEKMQEVAGHDPDEEGEGVH